MAETQSSTAVPVVEQPARGSRSIAESANNALMTPFLIGANVGLAAVNMAAEGASRAANMEIRLGTSTMVHS